MQNLNRLDQGSNDFTGDMLTTSGDDALTKTYKHGINKKWYEYAEIGLRKVRSPALTGF